MIVELSIVCFTILVLASMWKQPWRDYEDESVHDLAHEKSTVMVNLLTGDAVRGVVVRSTRTFIELAEGKYMGSTTQVNTQGVIRIPRTNVLFVQDVTTAAEPLASAD